jgi:hypothetical protein
MPITAMPSPRGTNHERLYILQGRKSTNPQAAYDAMPRRDNLAAARAYGERYARKLLTNNRFAYDLELEDADENERQNEVDEADAKIEESINGITEWCKGNLSHIDIKKLVNQLLDHTGAMDSRRKFAQDSRLRSTGFSEAGRQSFEQMFGSHAANLKVL